MFRPPREDIFNNKDISKTEGKPQPLLGIPLIEATRAYTAADIAIITTAQVELPNNSIEDFKEVLALIKSNGDDISKVNAVDKLDWI